MQCKLKLVLVWNNCTHQRWPPSSGWWRCMFDVVCWHQGPGRCVEAAVSVVGRVWDDCTHQRWPPSPGWWRCRCDVVCWHQGPGRCVEAADPVVGRVGDDCTHQRWPHYPGWWRCRCDVVCWHQGPGRCAETADPVVDHFVDDFYETNIKLLPNIKRTEGDVIPEIEFLAINTHRTSVENLKTFTQIY